MRYGFLLSASILFASCGEKVKITVTNDLPFERSEVVSVDLKEITSQTPAGNWRTTEGDSVLANQLLDTDGDSVSDVLLIYAKVQGNAKAEIEVAPVSANDNESPIVTYSRFVPERTDDYTWENDLVAFRTYGPVAQQLVEQGKEGGTLSSGLDCWLKRVHYPIIDKWYKKYTEGGTYHKDDGEGYDPYHVGKSRGCGGIGVWKNDSLYVSKNFVSYKKVVDGPIRNVFELTYASWRTDSAVVEETKRITIDAGSQLYKVEELLNVNGRVPNFTIGITLHEKKGTTSLDSVNGIFSYWEPVDDSELGTAVVIDPSTVSATRDFRTTKKDLSHIYISVKPDDMISFYTGFAWKKAGAINDATEWKTYLNQFKQKLQSPLKVEIKK